MNLSSYLLVLLVLSFAISWGGDTPRKGWFWYKESVKKKEEEEKKKEREKPVSKEASGKKKKFEFPVRPDAPAPVREFLKNPNEQTAEEFLAWQYKYFKHLEKVGFALQQAYLKKGRELYPIRGYPQTPLLAVEYQTYKKDMYKKVFSSLKDKIGIIYFFSANCGACKMENPLIEQLYYKYELPIRAVSVDGTIEDFPFPVVVNPDLALKMGVKVTPTIVLVIDKGNEPVINFVGVGFTPLDLLESRIIMSLVVNGVITGQELNANWELMKER